jgi:hypothetical protein
MFFLVPEFEIFLAGRIGLTEKRQVATMLTSRLLPVVPQPIRYKISLSPQ